MHYHHVEEILESWEYVTFAPTRLKQQIAENIQQFASNSELEFSDNEMQIIQETKDFLYAL